MFLLYLLAVSGWITVMYLAQQVAPDASFLMQLFVLVLSWLGCGYAPNRPVLHPLIEEANSPMATIDSQSRIKMACLLWWPIKYPELIVRVFFTRHV